MMVLAATQSLKWRREAAAAAPAEPPAYEQDDGALTDEQLAEIEAAVDELNQKPEPESILAQHPYLNKEFVHFENLRPIVAPSPESEVLLDDESLFEPLSEHTADTDNETAEELPENVRIADTTYGVRFPDNPKKGDLHVRTDYVPTKLYKYIGTRWIEIYKNTTDSYAYNSAYIDFLIKQIEQGLYDPELLTDSEREQISTRLRPDQ
jgi:hypothetical protein